MRSACQARTPLRSLSPQHAQDLLKAFRQDVTKHRYADWDELIDYCRYSAMPVGRFVLDVHGESRSTWPTGVITVSTIAILFAGSFAEWAGVHAFLGAFLMGTALGNGGDEQSARAQATMTQFVLSFFAPLYFVSLGLDADFVTHFDPGLVLGLLAVACAFKIGAVLLGARLAGMPLDRGVRAVGCALNARGATGLVLASVGLEYGLIDQRLYVALVVISLATSLLAVPTLRHFTAPPVLEPVVQPES